MFVGHGPKVAIDRVGELAVLMEVGQELVLFHESLNQPIRNTLLIRGDIPTGINQTTKTALDQKEK